MELNKKSLLLLLLLIPILVFAGKDIYTNSEYHGYNVSNISVLNATTINQNGQVVLDVSDESSLNVNDSNTSTYWDGETSQANLNVNDSNTSSYWDGETSQANLNVNDSNSSSFANSSSFWDDLNSPFNIRNLSDVSIDNMTWTKLYTYPSACSSGLWVSTISDSNTCTAPTAADVDPGTFPSGDYVFQGDVNVTTGNISQNDDYYHCFGDDCDSYIYFNGTDMVIKVN